MREVTVYGIRVIGTTEILYVGATTSLVRRRGSPYNSQLTARLRGVDWEYVVLETTDLENSADIEAKWVTNFRGLGHSLHNIAVPARLSAGPVAPLTASGPSGPSLTDARRTELGHGRLSLRMPQAAIDELGREAKRRGCSRAKLIETLINDGVK